jgi:hypothetical protein
MSQSRTVMQAEPGRVPTMTHTFRQKQRGEAPTLNSRTGEQSAIPEQGSESGTITQNDDDDGGGDKVETESTPDLTRQQCIHSERNEEEEGVEPDTARPSALDPVFRQSLLRKHHVEVNRDDLLFEISTRGGVSLHRLLRALDNGFGPITYGLNFIPRSCIIRVTKQLVKVVGVDSWTEDDWLNYVGAWLQACEWSEHKSSDHPYLIR